MQDLINQILKVKTFDILKAETNPAKVPGPLLPPTTCPRLPPLSPRLPILISHCAGPRSFAAPGFAKLRTPLARRAQLGRASKPPVAVRKYALFSFAPFTAAN